MSASVTTKWSILGGLSLFSLCISGAVRGQNGVSESYAEADRELNAIYKQAIVSLPAPSQEILRRAERAWIEFTKKNAAVLVALQRNNLISREAVDHAFLDEVRARREQLQIFFLGNKLPYSEPLVEWQREEERLTEAYQNCLLRFPKPQQLLLRDAERAWIVYRDADVRAIQIVSHQPPNPPGWAASAEARLASIRRDQLVALSPEVSNTPRAVIEEHPPTPTLGFDDTRQVNEWQEHAKEILLDLTTEKDCAFFQEEVKKMKSLPLPPPETLRSTTSCFNDLTKLRSDEESHGIFPVSPILQPTVNEASTITLLNAWSEFVPKMKSGELDAAGGILSKALQNKPNPLSPDYAPIWEKIEEWKGAYDRATAEFREHLKKGRDSFNLGKTTDAIREYQAAYDLVEDPKILPEIKKIRDQTLGL